MLFKYYEKHPEVFRFMSYYVKNVKRNEPYNWDISIEAEDIWDVEDPNKKAIETYLWLIKQEEVHEPNSGVNSTKISKKRINKLL